MAELLRGAPVAAAVRSQIAAALAASAARFAEPPCLANVVLGEEPASAAYLDAIDRSAAKAGVLTRRVQLSASAGEREILECLAQLGDDRSVHGILLQQPLPRGLDARRVAAALPAEKDVDGAGLAALGSVLAGERCQRAPCTAAAVVELLASDPRFDPAGRDVVIIGRSLVVGRPLAAMLASPGPGGQATVTLCHTRTRDLSAHTLRAEILIVAAGVPALLRPEMVRPGTIVIDVGTHPITGPDGPTLCGDVDPAVAAVAGFLTPVPGGVGPLTNAILLRHVTAAARPGYLPPAW
ncbi:MAG: bifunctional 5,10-methylenetetrahydrofolate dehydrogenase/5,10-methenyltetrahydrofolate cyclohydrolase [Planctomycetota bacterium]